jgi:hypothetical protein
MEIDSDPFREDLSSSPPRATTPTPSALPRIRIEDTTDKDSIRAPPAPIESSDPLIGPSTNFDFTPIPRGFSAEAHRFRYLNGKRGPSALGQELYPNKVARAPSLSPGGSPSLESTLPTLLPLIHAPTLPPSLSLAKVALFEARDKIIEAYTLSSDLAEKSKILDLLEVFREYIEKGRLQQASTIIASQVVNLEQATRKIEKKAKALAQPQEARPQASQVIQASTPLTFASAAAVGLAPGASPSQEWTLVSNKAKLAPKPSPREQARARAQNHRLVLVREASQQASFSAIQVRNAINEAFEAKGVKGPVVTTVATSIHGNIVVSTTPSFSADFLIEKRGIWDHLIQFKSIQRTTPWYKVVVHGIPIADFNNVKGMELVKEEIRIFNQGLYPIGTPYWLTSAEDRQVLRTGSVVVAFATNEEAKRAIRSRLYIAGISARVVKLRETPSTTQCTKCQGFGHLEAYCKKEAKCGLCSEPHFTRQHSCIVCKIKGASCPHLAPRCSNCQGTHTSFNKSCEVLQSLKRPNTTTSL